MRPEKAKAVDWEDICSFERNGKPRLLVGDTGDNGARRKSVRLYLIEEPSRPDAEVKPIQEIKLKYSTGAIDCEGLELTRRAARFCWWKKGRWLTCRIFQADLPKEKESEIKLTAKPIAVVKLPLVTGMDVSADGRRAVILTLGQAFEYQRNKNEDWATAFAREPRTVNLPPRKQGEAICYGIGGRDLYASSEFSPCPIFLIKAAAGPKSLLKP